MPSAHPTHPPSSFFQNTAAVATTFSIVGVLVLGGIILAVVLAKRRAARLQDEEDMTYFEKYNAGGANPGEAYERSAGASSPNMSFTAGPNEPEDLNDVAPTAHAANDAYHDRAMHYGAQADYGLPQVQMTQADYAQGYGYGAAAMDFPPTANVAGYGAYDATQYAGYADGYGAGYENQQYVMPAQDQTPYAPYGSQAQDPIARERSPTHPYADPSNMSRAAGAPAVQQHYLQPDESAYVGEAH